MASAPETSSRAQLPRNVWVVTATSFLTDVSSEMIFNLLPLFLMNVLGVHTNIIGIIEGLAESASSLLKVASGWFSDRIQSRKWLTVAGYSLSTIAKPFLVLATTWPAVLAIRFTDRLGKGIRTAPRDALIADSIQPQDRGLAFGIHRAGDTAGAFTGLLLAAIIVWITQSNAALLARSTFKQAVIISVIPAVLAVLVLILGTTEVRPAQSKTRQPETRQRLDRSFYLFLGIVALFTLGNSADAFLVLRAQERGLSVIGILAMLATFNLVYASISGYAGRLSDRIGRRALIMGGWLWYGLLYLGFALATTAWHIWALYALYGLYYGMVEGASRALVADLVPADQRGTAFGLYNAAVGIAALPASVLAGILWQGIGPWAGWGPQAPFLLGAVLALSATMLFVLWGRGQRNTINSVTPVN